MRIALVAPSEERTPPPMYGGTERIVDALQRKYAADGHDVTLYASGDSIPAGKLIACSDQAVRTLPEANNPSLRAAHNYRAIARAITHLARNGRDYDIIHNHAGWQVVPYSDLFSAPCVTTLHGSLTVPQDHLMYNKYAQHPYVSVSHSQQQDAPDLNYIATVYNGIPVEDFEPNLEPRDSDAPLVFLGRLAPEKGPEHAIDIAKKAGRRLIIAAKVDPVNGQFVKEVIKPQIDDEQICFEGEVDHRRKTELLYIAAGLLMPNQVELGDEGWREPFGLVAIEAMAMGVPVIAGSHGAMSETVADGVTGFVCDTYSDMVDRVADLHKIRPQNCRNRTVELFSADTMANGYLNTYNQILAA